MRYTEEFDHYSYLWDGSEPGWLLVGGGRVDLIYNEHTRQALVIEEDDTHRVVTATMASHGVPRITEEEFAARAARLDDTH